MTNEIALKDCPFCGDKPRVKTRLDEDLFTHNVVTWTGVYCTNCDVGFDWPPDVDVGAVEQWNTRALPAQGEPVRDQLVNALSAIEQRANESGTGEMGLLDTVHAMARIARVALALVKP